MHFEVSRAITNVRSLEITSSAHTVLFIFQLAAAANIELCEL